MYIVQFTLWGKSPKEEYYYHNLEDAQAHFDLFDESDGDLYRSIKIVNYDTSKTIARKDFEYSIETHM